MDAKAGRNANSRCGGEDAGNSFMFLAIAAIALVPLPTSRLRRNMPTSKEVV
ncbi:hypothetical protein GQ53DRAFT_742356 [Thozetella sp. PMI_491]|nr:hypothetical protein GQ53DRAFT_742356 [Thozetella sp. PMI_491]